MLKVKARKVAQGKKGKKKTWLSVENMIDQIAEGMFAQRDLIRVIDDLEGGVSDNELEDIVDNVPEYSAAVFYSLTLSAIRIPSIQVGILTDAAATTNRRNLIAALDFARKYREKEFVDYYGSSIDAAEELADSKRAYGTTRRMFRI